MHDFRVFFVQSAVVEHMHFTWMPAPKNSRPGVQQVPEGSGEEGKMEETGCEIICGALMTLTVEG